VQEFNSAAVSGCERTLINCKQKVNQPITITITKTKTKERQEEEKCRQHVKNLTEEETTSSQEIIDCVSWKVSECGS